MPDVDNRISSQLSKISTAFNCKLEALQAFIVSNISSMQDLDSVRMSARLSPDVSFSAPPEVPVPGPSHGLKASPHD